MTTSTAEARGVTSPAPKNVDAVTAAAIASNGKLPTVIPPKGAKRAMKKAPQWFDGASKKTPPKPTKSAKPAKTAKPGKKKAKATKQKKATRGDGPRGMVVDILKLASRSNGVSREELNTLTKWSGAPWKWLFKNPKGTGYCDRWGYTLRIAEGKDGETRYCVTKR
jgi:hypothetical protein